MDNDRLKRILEAALMAADRPLPLEQLEKLFGEGEVPSRNALKEALEALAADCEGRAFEVREVASGYRMQVRQDYDQWVLRLWDEKPPRYSRAFLETLALIAYRQPITRAEIEDIRGVAVSQHIVKTLSEREWIRVVGHKEVPGRPALLGTTRQFLDYFNLKSLDDLPTLAELRDLDRLHPELALELPPEGEGAEGAPEDVEAGERPDVSPELTAMPGSETLQ
ncbi:MAG: SMC-Scp complex subunit ScpB [Ectothiorhodospiraceae bacterium]|jgi:segregation and condensation protein B|nr:SMC-Scp complex subunit ScpB [Ectothiorhodospiraceae bacterium]